MVFWLIKTKKLYDFLTPLFGITVFYIWNMKSKKFAYKAWIIGLFGCIGLHRKYLNKPNTVIRRLTFGYLFIGSLIDLFLIPKWVTKHNAIIEISMIEKDLTKLLIIKSKVVNEQNFESAAWYREKEKILKSKIDALKKSNSLS